MIHRVQSPLVAAVPNRDRLLDQIVADAAQLLGVPVGILGLLDEVGESIQASCGWNISHLPAQYSLAARLRGESEPVIAADASLDTRFRSHPLVTGSPNLRFYAGVPLVDESGTFLGALSLVDRVAHVATPQQAVLLRLAGGRIAAELIARRRMHHVEVLRAAVEDGDERFRDFFERTTDLIMSIDADGRLLHANQAVFEALAIPREELINQPLSRVVDPALRDEFRIAFGEVIAATEAKTIETVFVSGSGQHIHVEGSVNPKVIDGRPVMARVMFRDISERIAFESELGRARDAAMEAARLKTQFLTNVSHEIRTPMNGIIGMIDLLLASPLNEEQRDFAHQASSSAEQLLTIVNNVLYVSNLEAGGLAAANVDFDLFRMLQRIVEVMKVAALGKELTIELRYDDRLPPLFRGNQAKLRQVVTNLMENAVKFTEQGTVTLHASLQMETASHRVVRFDVADSGIGISQEDRLLLFEKFSQVEATSTRRFRGVGLGLATARQLVETMGGLIDVESTPGSGSDFWFTLSFPKELAGRPIASSDLSFARKRMLLVDQTLTSRRITRHYLETTWDMRVDGAETAAEALAMLRKAASAGDPYEVAIYDRMRDLDELAFAREVRADAVIGRTRLVHVITTGVEPNEERMREAGIRAYVSKPVGQAELFDSLTIALAHEALSLGRSPMQTTSPRPAVLPPLPVPPEMRAKVRILLVEDNYLNAKLTMSQLMKLGYQADSAVNGKEALEALGRVDYDIIIMDCQMPVMDGYEATMEIRRRDDGRHRRRRIIAMTANALEGDREKCLAAGMDDYLAKPTKHDELEVALARHFV
jgi:two-component system sensor histidine kinase/response regulator